MDTSETLPGKWNRAEVDAAGNTEELIGNRRTGRRVGHLHSASVADTEVVREHTQQWNPDLIARWDSTCTSAAEEVGTANSASIAEGSDRVSGRGTNGKRGKVAWKSGECCQGKGTQCLRDI